MLTLLKILFCIDEKLLLKKVKIYSYKMVKSYELASKILVQDIQKNHKTEIYINYISINTDVDSKLFRESSLKRIPRL